MFNSLGRLKSICFVVGFSAVTLVLHGCETTPQTQASKEPVDCSKADNVGWVAGGGECLRIITENPKQDADALIVLLHGDVSGGDNTIPSDYFVRHSRILDSKANNFVKVVMIRPGYLDSQGNYSSGNNYNRFDQYTEHNTTAIGEAIQSLKAHYQAKRTVVLGHSGGAATAGVMMGLFPGIADAVLLGACPCYIARWRQQLQGRPMRRSLSPHKYIDQIDPSTKVVAVVGENDNNTFPSLSASYVKELKERGIDATLEVIPGQGHSDIAFRSRLYDVLSGLAKGSE